MDKQFIKKTIFIDDSNIVTIIFTMPYGKDFEEVLANVANEIDPKMSIVDLLFDDRAEKLFKKHNVPIVKIYGIHERDISISQFKGKTIINLERSDIDE